MEQRPFGSTGLRVSALGFGCGAVGGLMVRGEVAEQRRAVVRALEAGITYFDTAPGYGDGRSEENLGRVWRDLRPAGVVVGTKFRLDGADLGDIDGAIRRSLAASLGRLQFARVDLLQLHNQIGPGERALSPEIVLGPVLETLRRLRDEGAIGHFGITGMGDTAAVHQVIDSGQIASTQAYHNAANPSAGYAGRAAGGQDFAGLIGRARERGVGVIVIRPLAAGALAGDAPAHPNASRETGAMGGTTFASNLTRAERLAALAGQYAAGPVDLALRFAMFTPGVSTTIVGFSEMSHLEQAIRAAEAGPLPDGAIQGILATA